MFYVESGRLVRFIVSNRGIQVDPLKFEAIVNMPPPRSIRKLQSLQGKSNFLRRFIVNYAKITKGFIAYSSRTPHFMG